MYHDPTSTFRPLRAKHYYAAREARLSLPSDFHTHERRERLAEMQTPPSRLPWVLIIGIVLAVLFTLAVFRG
jgi:hypothetical protein